MAPWFCSLFVVPLLLFKLLLSPYLSKLTLNIYWSVFVTKTGLKWHGLKYVLDELFKAKFPTILYITILQSFLFMGYKLSKLWRCDSLVVFGSKTFWAKFIFLLPPHTQTHPPIPDQNLWHTNLKSGSYLVGKYITPHPETWHKSENMKLLLYVILTRAGHAPIFLMRIGPHFCFIPQVCRNLHLYARIYSVGASRNSSQ